MRKMQVPAGGQDVEQTREAWGLTFHQVFIPLLRFRGVAGALRELRRVLKPGGQFVTFAYLQGLLLPAGRRFRAKLKRSFSDVTKSKIVWRNLPPAFVYRCRR